MSELKKRAARAVAGKAGKIRKIRHGVQFFFLLVLNSLWFEAWHSKFNRVCVPVLNCHGCPAAANFCPVGIIGDMGSVRIVPWLAIGMFGLFGILVGRLTCGWVCPFGFLQDLLGKLPTPKFGLPRWTRHVKYVVFVATVILVPVLIGIKTNLFFCNLCPKATIAARGWFYLFYDRAIRGDALIVLGATILLTIFIERGFCRLVCPVGAGLALFNKFSLLSKKLDRAKCTECMLCVRNCPMDAAPYRATRDTECIYCLDCFSCRALTMNAGPDRGPRA